MSSIASSSTPKRARPAATAFRSHLAGALTRADVGREVRLGGWVHRRRDLGGLVFVDLRDRAGLVQLSGNPAWTPPDVMARMAGLGAETVVLVRGTVELRPEPSRDAALASRDVEVHVADLEVVGPAQTPAIPVARKEKEDLPAEELRLRHRVLDLRRPELQRNLILRHRLMQATRRYFDHLGFLEIETPILTKPTPEGARDYLVPSRVHRGEFFALPQSPQLYKQLLMMAGLDRYFQIARCFRDEDLRADRQPEFTQIDIEASFVGRGGRAGVRRGDGGGDLGRGGDRHRDADRADAVRRRHGAVRQRQAGPPLRSRDLRRHRGLSPRGFLHHPERDRGRAAGCGAFACRAARR